MFPCSWLFGIVVFSAVVQPGSVLAQTFNFPPNTTTCEEFEKSARFNPFLLTHTMWKIFYFWSNNTEATPIVFELAGKTRVKNFKKTFEAITVDTELEWEKATLFMNAKRGTEVLFMSTGTPGAFRAIIKTEQRNKARPNATSLIKYADVRMKMVDRWLGMMCCEDRTAYAMANMMAMPRNEEGCRDAAASLGYQGYEGRSYLSLLAPDKDEL